MNRELTRALSLVCAAGLALALAPESRVVAMNAVGSHVDAGGIAPQRLAPALDWGEDKYEFYQYGVVIHYIKGERMAMSDPGNGAICFEGEWIGPGYWEGPWIASDGAGDSGWGKARRSTSGKRLTISLGRGSRYTLKRSTARQSARFWGSIRGAKQSADACWGVGS